MRHKCAPWELKIVCQGTESMLSMTIITNDPENSKLYLGSSAEADLTWPAKFFLTKNQKALSYLNFPDNIQFEVLYRNFRITCYV